jgi:hypothetical protein
MTASAISCEMSWAESITITRPSLNSDGLTISASTGAVSSDTRTRVMSAVASTARAASRQPRTARSMSSSSSPRTRWSGAGAEAVAVTPTILPLALLPLLVR